MTEDEILKLETVYLHPWTNIAAGTDGGLVWDMIMRGVLVRKPERDGAEREAYVPALTERE